MAYGNVYVAQVAIGANDGQCVKAFLEAAAYDGPSIIIAFSTCIAHGYDMIRSLDQQEVAVKSGYWPLFRFNPMLAAQGKNPLVLDSKAPSVPLTEFTNNETRYTMLAQADPAAAKALGELAQHDVDARWKLYSHWATMAGEGEKKVIGDG
jgi:pyruvate-ferredoxin/flavodoxin oxidoreductase